MAAAAGALPTRQQFLAAPAAAQSQSAGSALLRLLQAAILPGHRRYMALAQAVGLAVSAEPHRQSGVVPQVDKLASMVRDLAPDTHPLLAGRAAVQAVASILATRYLTAKRAALHVLPRPLAVVVRLEQATKTARQRLQLEQLAQQARTESVASVAVVGAHRASTLSLVQREVLVARLEPAQAVVALAFQAVPLLAALAGLAGEANCAFTPTFRTGHASNTQINR